MNEGLTNMICFCNSMFFFCRSLTSRSWEVVKAYIGGFVVGQTKLQIPLMLFFGTFFFCVYLGGLRQTVLVPVRPLIHFRYLRNHSHSQCSAMFSPNPSVP